MEATDVVADAARGRQEGVLDSSTSCRPASRSGWSASRRRPASVVAPTTDRAQLQDRAQRTSRRAAGRPSATRSRRRSRRPGSSRDAVGRVAVSVGRARAVGLALGLARNPASGSPTRQGRRRRRRDSRSSRPCSSRTGRTRPGRWSRCRPPSRRRRSSVPIYTISLGTADGVVTVPDDQGQLHTVNVPPDTETLAAIAETTGGRAFEAPTSADLAADLPVPRVEDRLHDRRARGHSMVRRGRPAARGGGRGPRGALVQPVPVIA